MYHDDDFEDLALEFGIDPGDYEIGNREYQPNAFQDDIGLLTLSWQFLSWIESEWSDEFTSSQSFYQGMMEQSQHQIQLYNEQVTEEEQYGDFCAVSSLTFLD